MEKRNLCYGCFDDSSGQNPCPSCGYSPDSNPGAGLYLIPGTLLFNKYLVGCILGQGGFGITYLGWDTNLDIRIAIKEFFPQGLVSRVPGENSVISYSGEIKDQFSFGVESFLRESKTLARFDHHPNIVTVRDFFKENNTAYMVMSFIEGITLLEHLNRSGGRIPVEQAVQIIMPVLDALREVHRTGIMHRDISPDNLLIDKNGRVVLIDFGAARQAMGVKSKSLSVILKAGFAPEEQYRSKGKQGPWTDIYAVGATLYRAITGETPPEAMDRLIEDDLFYPSQLGVEIDFTCEEALLKSLAVKAEERYQTVDEFQNELMLVDAKDQTGEAYTEVRFEKLAEPVKSEIRDSEEDKRIKAQRSNQLETANAQGKKPVPAIQPASLSPQVALSYKGSKKTFIPLVLIILCGILLFGGVYLFVGDDYLKGLVGYATEETAQIISPNIIADFDADYYFDYKNGAIPIGDLPIGSRVIDPSWEWEFRTGDKYTRAAGDETKHITWLIVAKNHYDGLEPHVTLLSEELIGLYTYDNSTGRGHEGAHYGYSHWGESGTANATRGLRQWLNSTGIYSGEGFYEAFPESLKEVLITTTLPNKEWKNGNVYTTQDLVFIPSTTELGDTDHEWTHQIGKRWPFFSSGQNKDRIAKMADVPWWYWMRSPFSDYGYSVRNVSNYGELYHRDFQYNYAYNSSTGIRPALNIKSETLVSEINP